MCFARSVLLARASKASRNVSFACLVLARLPSGSTLKGEQRGERFPVITACSWGANGKEHETTSYFNGLLASPFPITPDGNVPCVIEAWIGLCLDSNRRLSSSAITSPWQRFG
eukprot:1444754-Karenia_brevis.AAC.1